MFGSIYIGLSGLNAYSDGLKTVSNNVSNLNTLGFKSSDVTFANIYGASNVAGLDYTTSGSNSGHGVYINNVSLDFDQGELQQTNRDLDLAVDGSGFFVLLDGDQTYYTRTGSFYVDNDGYVVLAETDYQLAVLDSTERPTAVNIDAYRTNAPTETTAVEFSDNLSSTATEHTIADLSVYDESGEEHLWTVEFTREETVHDEWTVKVTDGTGTEIGSQILKTLGGIVDPTTDTLVFEDIGSGLSVTFDFSNLSSYSSGTVSSLRVADIDGYPTGTVTTLTVNGTGQLEITYSNEETLELGAIALADFRDPQNLEQRSGGLFAHSGYGQVQYLGSEDSRVGTIITGYLEASNVDLGSQFGNLIMIQRGFQASSQIISISNDMIQQLFGIRGQG